MKKFLTFLIVFCTVFSATTFASQKDKYKELINYLKQSTKIVKESDTSIYRESRDKYDTGVSYRESIYGTEIYRLVNAQLDGIQRTYNLEYLTKIELYISGTNTGIYKEFKPNTIKDLNEKLEKEIYKEYEVRVKEMEAKKAALMKKYSGFLSPWKKVNHGFPKGYYVELGKAKVYKNSKQNQVAVLVETDKFVGETLKIKLTGRNDEFIKTFKYKVTKSELAELIFDFEKTGSVKKIQQAFLKY